MNKPYARARARDIVREVLGAPVAGRYPERLLAGARTIWEHIGDHLARGGTSVLVLVRSQDRGTMISGAVPEHLLATLTLTSARHWATPDDAVRVTIAGWSSPEVVQVAPSLLIIEEPAERDPLDRRTSRARETVLADVLTRAGQVLRLPER
ncbi:hypothetical protein DWB68_15085 [Galactobacter valiniphilus]|uniref:Uncharacterized protein n=1 Tax=Galactobacter valiniphilus TaxID=2676122 RepID=A0A399J6A9_9MICC|nr:hypothetical protein [Galactobacter valiniphilus]RII40971.1 hypothetical protein DWB68_15085 [Galactobacter valiniphilus]